MVIACKNFLDLTNVDNIYDVDNWCKVYHMECLKTLDPEDIDEDEDIICDEYKPISIQLTLF